MVKPKFIRLLIAVACCLALALDNVADAQNAPVTTIATVGNALPGQISVPISVSGFNNIGAISLSFDYPYAGLHYLQGEPNPLLPGFAIGDNDMGNGKHRITMGWFGDGTSLPDGSVIMLVKFDFIEGITPLGFYDNGPSCEYADGSYNVLNDIPQSSYYINGYVCGAIGNPGPIAGDPSVCQGQTNVAYSVSPVVNATSYTWTVPSGATIVSGNNTNVIVVDFSLIAVSGNITVNGSNICGTGPQSLIPVAVTPLPVANAGPDIAIPFGTSTTLHAANGGAGSYGYYWSPATLLVNPNLQDPQTVNLTSTTMFNVQVTNQATLCSATDDVVVTITGGPLHTNPMAIPTAVCLGGSAQLFANAGGGSGNYTYSWTSTPAGNPPWTSSLANPMVAPEINTTYHLLLSDGFNTVAGNTSVAVFPLPTAHISGGDTLCGPGTSTTLTIDLTGSPPWNFSYTNGPTTWPVTSQTTTPYTFPATLPGNYTVVNVSDQYCSGAGSGSAMVAVNPIPPTPSITVNGTDLTSSGCCGNQWYLDGILIPGANGQDYQPLKTAHYFTIVTIDGCASDTSNTIYYFMTGTQNYPELNFTVEPNPADSYISIRVSDGNLLRSRIQVSDLSGKTILINYLNSHNNHATVDIQQLSAGIYFIYLVTTYGISVQKLLIR